MASPGIPGLTPGFKFAPDDDEVIELYLVPRLRNRDEPLPLDGVIIDADPRSAPPWELFSRHGRDQANDAFFFAPGDAAKGHKARACAGVGTWVGQRAEKTGKKLIGETIFKWQKYRLNFHCGSGKSGSIGWVMMEYSVVAPDADVDCTSFKICHISFTGHGQRRKRVPDGCDGGVTHQHLEAAATSSMALQTHDAGLDGATTGPWIYQHQELSGTTTDQHPPLDDLGSFYLPLDAGVDGATAGPWIYQHHQEPFPVPMEQQCVDQEQLPPVDLDIFHMPLPAMDPGIMPLHAGTETSHISFTSHGQKRRRVPDGYVDCDNNGVTHLLQVAANSSMPLQTQVYSDAGVDGATQQQQLVDHGQPPLDDLGSSCLTDMDQETMPLHMDEGTCVPEQFAEYGTMPPTMDQDDDDPVLGQILESLGDLADAVQADAAFGDPWASAGQSTPVL
jgi:hypothetical protein